MWEWLFILAIILIIIIRNKKRGYVWKDKKGKQLNTKQFFKRWGQGISEATPLQQTKTSLLAFPLLYGGIIWGITMTLMSGTYWMSLILIGSLPLTSMQLLSTWQRFKSQKKIEELIKEAEKNEKKKRRKK